MRTSLLRGLSGPLALLTSLLAGCAPADVSEVPHALALEPLRDSIQAEVDRGELPGAVFTVQRGDASPQTVRVGFADIDSRTPLTEESLFRAASATKIWVTSAFMTLVEDGTVELAAPVSHYLPDFADLRVFNEDGTTHAATNELTVLDLLRHTGGMGYGYDDPYQAALVEAGLLQVGTRFSMNWSHDENLEGWSRRLATVPLEAEPGTEFSYGLNHDLLGALVERVTGERLDDFVSARLLEPMGLTHTGFTVAEDQRSLLTRMYSWEDGRLVDVPYATEAFFQRPVAVSGGGGWDQPGLGGLVTSAGDFRALLRMLLSGGVHEGRRILSEESVALLFRNHLEGIGSGDSYWPGVGFSFGFAYLYDPERYEGPGSSGRIWWAGSTNVYFWVDPAEEMVAVLLANVLPFGHLGLMDAVEALTYEALEAQTGN